MPSLQDFTGASPEEIPGARAARGGAVPLHRVGLLAIVCALVAVGCGTHRDPIATAPASATADASADASIDVSELGATAKTPRIPPSTLGGPLAGLDAGLLARFNAGLDDFSEEEGIDDGIGPVFNEVSCKTCHDQPVGGTTGRGETRFGRVVDGRFDPLAEKGGSLMQDHAIGMVSALAGTFTFVPEVVPPEANVVATRITTPLFGLGLVDAVPDQTFLDLARLEAIRSPATAGVPSMASEIRTGATRVGRFGWKCQEPTLHQFAGDAYLNEMGVTNADFPDESCPQGNCALLAFNPVPTLNNDGTDVARFEDLMTLFGPPPRNDRGYHSPVGEAVFRSIGCANCHTPSLVTGPSPVAALSYKVFSPFSDFLLHDMGSLGDGIAQGSASGRQMRTAPLWGLQSDRHTYLHDGRAKSVEAAILAHAGQGLASRNMFLRLNPGMRNHLLSFLGSL